MADCNYFESRRRQPRYLFHNNSIDKATYCKDLWWARMNSLAEKTGKLARQTKIRQKSVEMCRISTNWEAIYKDSIKTHYLFIRSQHNAAITIQKMFRGMRVRAEFNAILLDILEKKTSFSIQSLENQVKKIFLEIPMVVSPAVLLIQCHYRRYRFIKKISAWQAYYMHLKQLKSLKSENFLRDFLSSSYNRLIIHNKKYLIHRNISLQRIRRNLAIYSIKSYWIIHNITFADIKLQLQRYKHRKSLLISREKYLKYLENFNGIKPNDQKSSSSEDESFATVENIDMQYKQTEKLKRLVEMRIKDRVDKGKISYSVGRIKPKMILPVIGEKFMHLQNNIRRVASRGCEVTEGRRWRRPDHIAKFTRPKIVRDCKTSLMIRRKESDPSEDLENNKSLRSIKNAEDNQKLHPRFKSCVKHIKFNGLIR